MNILYAVFAGKSSFTGLMLVGSVLKLLFSLIGIFVYSILFPINFPSFSIQFILAYIIFTFFEIRYLLKLISQQKKHENK